ncbi:MAG: DUF6798 domain-containing protein [Cyanobacteria bacterium P01_G01_bin.38]
MKRLSSFTSSALSVLTIAAFLSLGFVLTKNMGTTNEIHHLPLARQAFDPSWVPGDIYYSEDPGYRWLFQRLFGPMTASLGFLATSLVGRLVGYSCLATGLWCLGRQLGLGLWGMLLALCLFIYPNTNAAQGAIAQEWLIGGIEPKVFAYSLMFMALSFALSKRYLWMVVCLGLSASFHVLVGGWSTIAMGLWLLIRRQTVFANARQWGTAVLLYGIASVFALRAVLKQLMTPVSGDDAMGQVRSIPTGEFSPSYLYTFLRNPHHVNPLSWAPFEWLVASLYLIVFLGIVVWLRRQARVDEGATLGQNRLAFAGFVGACLMLFAVGVCVAPFDLQGKFLQYYPFRVGDLMLPLGTCLLVATMLETLLHRRWFVIGSVVVLGLAISFEVSDFQQSAVELVNFPGEAQQVKPDWKDMCGWIKANTPRDSLIVSQPDDLDSLYWLAERPTVAKFRFVPSASSAEVAAWYERIVDLGGGLDLLADVDRHKDPKKAVRRALNQGYFGLETVDAIALLEKYQADYFLTQTAHQLDLPIVYRNASHILYGKQED